MYQLGCWRRKKDSGESPQVLESVAMPRTGRELTGSGGLILDTTNFSAFGQILSSSNQVIGDRFAFTGRETTAETGSYNYRARTYRPSIGRFYTVDPLSSLTKEGNSLSYAGNNPLNRVDPSGMISIVSTAILSGLASGLASGIATGYSSYSATGKVDFTRVGLGALTGAILGVAGGAFAGALGGGISVLPKPLIILASSGVASGVTEATAQFLDCVLNRKCTYNSTAILTAGLLGAAVPILGYVPGLVVPGSAIFAFAQYQVSQSSVGTPLPDVLSKFADTIRNRLIALGYRP